MAQSLSGLAFLNRSTIPFACKTLEINLKKQGPCNLKLYNCTYGRHGAKLFPYNHAQREREKVGQAFNISFILAADSRPLQVPKVHKLEISCGQRLSKSTLYLW